MFIITDLLATLGIVVLITEMTTAELIPAWLAGWMLVFFVGFRAFARATGGVGKSIYWLFTASFYGVLLIFLVLSGGWNHIVPLLVNMFFGGLEKIIARISVLYIEGHIGIYALTVSICILLIIRFLGLVTGSHLIYWTLFSIAAPVFVFLTMFSMAKIGDWRGVIQIGGGILALIVLLEGFYIIIYGIFSPKRGEIRA